MKYLVFRITILMLLLCHGRMVFGQSGDSVRLPKHHDFLVDSFYTELLLLHHNDSLLLADTIALPRRLAGKKMNLSSPSFGLSASFISSPFLLTGGSAQYNFLYQSFVDTPFVENDISQHQALVQLNAKVANFLPVQVRFWSRVSNSVFFRDLYDVQVVYDASQLNTQLYSEYTGYINRQAELLRDNRLETLYAGEWQRLNSLSSLLKLPELKQRKLEAEEIIQVPSLSYDHLLPDSLNYVIADSIQARAKAFLAAYQKLEKKYNQLHSRMDSLEKVKQNIESRIHLVKGLLQRSPGAGTMPYSKIQEELDKYLPGTKLPPIIRWLTGVRKLSLGRTPLQASELTARNVSINGLHLEYSDWYFYSLTVGGMDYRFRDFKDLKAKRRFSPFYMGRLGIGRLEQDFIILSIFSGKKPVPSREEPNRTLKVTGISLEGRTRLGQHSFIQAEVGQSISPDYRLNPYVDRTKLGFNKEQNGAVALKAGSYIPNLKTRLEGMYKRTGTNYQSFSTWQVNTALESWYIKWDQVLLGRKLRLTASLRSNEFSNPNLPQAYKTNTIFKSVFAVFRTARWPVISLGFIPVSQVLLVNELLMETRFQTLTASLFHHYRLNHVRMATTVAVNKSFTPHDSVSLFGNATNITVAQNVFFRLFTSSLQVTENRNTQYAHLVLDHKLQFPLHRLQASIGVGVKVSTFNYSASKAGYSINTAFRLFGNDQLSVYGERSYLPVLDKGLVRSDFGSLQYVRTFSFSRTSNPLKK